MNPSSHDGARPTPSFVIQRGCAAHVRCSERKISGRWHSRHAGMLALLKQGARESPRPVSPEAAFVLTSRSRESKGTRQSRLQQQPQRRSRCSAGNHFRHPPAAQRQVPPLECAPATARPLRAPQAPLSSLGATTGAIQAARSIFVVL